MTYWSLASDADLLWHADLQDDAASTAIVAETGANGVLNGGDNTTDLTTTGPGAWLPKALSLDGSSDFIDCVEEPDFDNSLTLVIWNKTTDSDSIIRADSAIDTTPIFAMAVESGKLRLFQRPDSGTSASALGSTDVDDDTWRHFAMVGNDSGLTKTYIDSVLESSDTTPSGTISHENLAIGAANRSSPTAYQAGEFAGAFAFNRALTSSEIAELYAGPEPTNTTAPTIAVQGGGNPDVGATLEVDSDGTWDSHSNGTVTYTYQWKADGSDIGGETSSTLDTTGRSAGEEITCVVAASNDGGNDPTEDTETSGITLTAASSGPSAALLNHKKKNSRQSFRRRLDVSRAY